MKRKFIKISIFIMMLASLCAVCFVPQTKVSVQAATTDAKSNYLLIGDNNKPYTTNVVVGRSSGDGKYVVGQTKLNPIEATAEVNFELVGWQVTYLDQNNKVQIFDNTELTNNSKKVNLTDLQNNKIEATIVFEDPDGDCHYESGKFTLSQSFENIIVSPVYDHIYYNVDITEINDIVALSSTSNITIGEDTLYYTGTPNQTEKEETKDNVTTTVKTTTYKDLILKSGTNYYFHGTVYKDEIKVVENAGTADEQTSNTVKYYTIHKTLQANPVEEKIDLAKGAFRIGDNVKIKKDINIIPDNFTESKNVDIVGFNINSEITPLVKYSDGVEYNYYKTSKDSYLRTTDFEIDFNIIYNNKTYVNVVDVDYHNLYVATVNLIVDGVNASAEQLEEIIGNPKAVDKHIEQGNVLTSNFYSIIDNVNYLQFFVKNSYFAYPAYLKLEVSEKISTVKDNIPFLCYNFKSIDGGNNTNKTYNSVSSNININVEYTVATYTVEFKFAEFTAVDSTKGNLKLAEGNVNPSILLKRGEQKTLNSNEIAENIGYKYLGYSNVLGLVDNQNITQEIDVAIDKTKPTNKVIYVCYEKIDYQIELFNYNKISLLDGTKPIKTITFVTNNAIGSSYEYANADLGTTSTIVGYNIQVGQTTNISAVANNGFEILGYSLKSTIASNEDYLVNNSFVLTEELIESLNGGTVVKIYVFEEYINYQLTYLINEAHDLTLQQDVIMASISHLATTVTDVVVEKYDVDGVLIDALDTTTAPTKIVISNLKYSDQVSLISNPYTVEASATVAKSYTYAFSYFTEDHKLHLSKVLTKDQNDVVTEAVHNEKITRSRTIEVVYSVPNTRVEISIEEDFATSENFSYNLVVKQSDVVIYPQHIIIEDNENTEGEPSIGGGEPGANGGTTTEGETGTNGEETEDVVENIYGGIYIVEPGAVTLTIEKLEFGYVFYGYEVDGVKTAVTVAPDENGAITFDYVANSGSNNIILLFDRVEYKFKFAQYGGNVTPGTFVQFDSENGVVDYVILDIDNTSVEFNKPLGYYVATVHFGDGIDTYSTDLSETNDYRNNKDILTYSKFNLNTNIFLEIVQNEELCEDYVVNVTINYLRFMYNVSVNRHLDKPKNGTTYPAMQLTYVDVVNSVPQTFIADATELNGYVVFSGIPYGVTNAKITLLTDVRPGLKVVGSGWAGNVSGYTYTLKELQLGVITKDCEFVYQLNYYSYEIKLVYDDMFGNPYMRINDSYTSKTVSLFDEVQIYPEPSRDKGYKFKQFVYQKATYVPYDYANGDWENDHATLYVLNNGAYALNTSDIYNANTAYYIANFETVTATEFYDYSFDVANYVVQEGDIILIGLEYELLQMNIENISLQEDSRYSLIKGSGEGELNIEASNFASYTMEITDEKGEHPDRELVNYYDTIKIIVNINDAVLNDKDNVEYDLRKGLKLNSVSINNNTINPTILGNGKYEFSFQVGSYMPQNGETIKIVYVYGIQDKSIKVTTVVDSSETAFYKNTTLYVDGKTYGFNTSVVGSKGKASINPNLQFLAMADVYAELSADYAQYFVIKGVDVKIGGQTIERADYAKYGLREPTAEMHLVLRLIYDLEIIFKVQPIITYNYDNAAGDGFSSVFKCDNTGTGIAQSLSFGASNDSKIKIAGSLAGRMVVKYVPVDNISATPAENVTNVGSYRIIITFKPANAGESYDWLKDIQISDIVIFEIIKKDISLNYDDKLLQKVEKPYDGNSSFEVVKVYPYLLITDDNGLSIKYADIIQQNRFVLSNIDSYIAYNKQATNKANDNVYYDYYLYNIVLKDDVNDKTEFNDNFNLVTKNLTVKNYIKIKRIELDLANLEVYSKVYDTTDSAEIVLNDEIKLLNVIPADRYLVGLDVSKLKAKFVNSNIGINKTVVIDAADALINLSEDDVASNYYISNNVTSKATIYPYELTVNIKDVGDVKIVNNRGLTDKSMVNLIPVNSYLSVEVVKPDSAEYANIYRTISGRLKRNNIFAMGYNISLVVNGETQNLSRYLYISVPNAKNLTGVYGINQNGLPGLSYQVDGNNILIDLNSSDGEINQLFLTQKRVLFKAWQIVLIVLLGVLVVAGVVITLVIIRKRKIDRYSINEKI